VTIELRPSTDFSVADLAVLFTASYECYAVPFVVDASRLAFMVDAFASTGPSRWSPSKTEPRSGSRIWAAAARRLGSGASAWFRRAAAGASANC
jgi:hypothetical protein